jgi:hypothetical protein
MQECKKVVYSFADETSQILFVDKRDVIKNQLEACQRLLPYISKIDTGLVEKEIFRIEDGAGSYAITNYHCHHAIDYCGNMHVI